MAWRNALQPESETGIPQNVISDPDGFVTAYKNATIQQRDNIINTYCFPTWNGIKATNAVSGKLLGDSTNYIQHTLDTSSSTTTYAYKMYYNDSHLNMDQSGWHTNDYEQMYLALVDDENQVSFFTGLIRYRTNQGCGKDAGTNPQWSGENSQKIYTILTANPLITYEWTPVSSVYGKLGTINLSKLKDINDGEPVTGASSSAVNLTDKSLISILVGNVIVDDNKVGVEYSIPSGTYEYIKLVYKQDSEPEDASDGTAIDLEIGDGVIGISGINDGNTYFFKIFTDINASQAYEFTTEKPVVPPEYQPYLNMINGRRQYNTWNLQMDFFWYDYVGDPNDHGFYWFDGTASEHSFFLRDQRPTVYYFDTKNTSYMCSYQSGNNADTRKICAAPITDIYIISSGNSYTFSTDLSGKIQALWVNDRFGGGYHHYSGTIEMKPYNGNPGTFSFGVDTSDGSSSYTEFTFTGTLEEVFKILSMYCRNVNIYVDNVCWSKVN